MTLFDTGIRPIIDEHLLRLAEEQRNYGNYWSASSAGYCYRRLIFERLKVPYVTQDARKQRVFTSGHLFHSWIQGLTKEAGLSIAQELELQDEDLMVRGHIDDLVLVGGEVTEQDRRFIRNTDDYGISTESDRKKHDEIEAKSAQHLILYDYKTVHSKSFNYKKDSMSHYWKMQLGTYMYMLRQGKLGEMKAGELAPNTTLKFPLDLTEARILTISKDDLRMGEVQLLWSPELEKEVYEYWSTLNGYWKAKKMPRCTCADREGGFLANEKYNPYYYDGEPCSIKYYEQWKAKEATA